MFRDRRHRKIHPFPYCNKDYIYSQNCQCRRGYILNMQQRISTYNFISTRFKWDLYFSILRFLFIRFLNVDVFRKYVDWGRFVDTAITRFRHEVIGSTFTYGKTFACFFKYKELPFIENLYDYSKFILRQIKL